MTSYFALQQVHSRGIEKCRAFCLASIYRICKFVRVFLSLSFCNGVGDFNSISVSLCTEAAKY